MVRVRTFAEAIKLSHSVFALPFAVSAAFMAAGGLPEPALLGKIILACVFARSAAMSFNRLVDARIDAANPRTAARAVPAGALSRRFMVIATLLSLGGFVACAGWINELALRLAPIAIAVLLGYSWTKRFTSLSHLVLGAALGLSPVGAWVAVRAELAMLPAILGAAVLFWTAGFDVIYACQDRSFDSTSGLRSIPVRFGIARALWLSRAFHALAVALLGSAGALGGHGWPFAIGVAGVAALLVYEQSLVRPDDLSRVGVAFFTLNGAVSVFFMSAVIVDTVS